MPQNPPVKPVHPVFFLKSILQKNHPNISLFRYKMLQFDIKIVRIGHEIKNIEKSQKKSKSKDVTFLKKKLNWTLF